MNNIAYIHTDRALPDLSVFELAVASAISRQTIASDEDLQEVLSDWFVRSIRVPEVSKALDRMIDRGLVRRADETLCHHSLTGDGIRVVTALYGGCIRMIHRGLGSLDLSTIHDILKIAKEPDDA